MSGDEKRLAMKNRHVRARCALGCAALVMLSLECVPVGTTGGADPSAENNPACR